MHRQRLSPDGANNSILPEDELQRQQLLRLLLQQETNKNPSPQESQQTFRIDLPTGSGRVTAPQTVYGGRDIRDTYMELMRAQRPPLPLDPSLPGANARPQDPDEIRRDRSTSREGRRQEIEIVGRTDQWSRPMR